jgi:hypothetical protein
MTIRKTGAVTGEVTGVEGGSLAREASLDTWSEADTQDLAAENEAADGTDD